MSLNNKAFIYLQRSVDLVGIPNWVNLGNVEFFKLLFYVERGVFLVQNSSWVFSKGGKGIFPFGPLPFGAWIKSQGASVF
jgi:hypothetical protein